MFMTFSIILHQTTACLDSYINFLHEPKSNCAIFFPAACDSYGTLYSTFMLTYDMNNMIHVLQYHLTFYTVPSHFLYSTISLSCVSTNLITSLNITKLVPPSWLSVNCLTQTYMTTGLA